MTVLIPSDHVSFSESVTMSAMIAICAVAPVVSYRLAEKRQHSCSSLVLSLIKLRTAERKGALAPDTDGSAPSCCAS